MSEIQEEYVPVEQIVVTGNLVKRIMNKNMVPAMVTIPLGILMMLLKDTACTIVAGILILAALVYLVVIKDHVTFDIYDDCVIVYHDKDQNREDQTDQFFSDITIHTHFAVRAAASERPAHHILLFKNLQGYKQSYMIEGTFSRACLFKVQKLCQDSGCGSDRTHP